MKAARLLAFGCSLTYGHGLKDCCAGKKKDKEGPRPSKYSWPAILSNMLDRECVNLSEPGSSNKKICNKVLSTNFRSDDMVFINWSYISRSCCIAEKEIINLDLKAKGKLNSAFRNLSTRSDLAFMSAVFVNYIGLYLKNKNINHYHLVTDRDFLHLEQIDAKLLQSSIQSIRQKHKKALDNLHPGEDAHLEFAKSIYNEIKE